MTASRMRRLNRSEEAMSVKSKKEIQQQKDEDGKKKANIIEQE